MRVHRRDSLDQARAHLGDEQLDRAYAQGMETGRIRYLRLRGPIDGRYRLAER